MTQPLLDIRNLTLDIATFDGLVPVLKAIDLTVHRGDTFGIVGESGSGKTVLARSILGIAPKRSKIASGSMRFDGIDLLGLSGKGWRELRGARISMIFQDPMSYLNPLFTAGRQISDAIAAHEKASGRPVSSKSERQKRAEELLDQVGILEPARIFASYPHQLSGGMRQRILIAMALSGKPDLLIADEPTTALDVTVQAQVLDLIDELVSKLNLTVIMISHDVGVIATITKRCAVMYKGEIVEQGLTADILGKPRHDYSRQLLAAVLDIDDAPTKTALVSDKGEETAPLLEAVDLKKVYRLENGKNVVAVDGISFSVAPGEILGIVGESGSGKSTVARLVLRLIEPTAGNLTFDGCALNRLGEEDLRRMRRHMQLVFQNPHSALDERHTVADAIAEPLRLQTQMSRRDIERRVEALLDIVHLPKALKYRYPHELSGGQKQRICIARAISLNPKFLVLDEPTSALDLSVQAQIIDFLQELRRDLKLTYLFISHNLAVIHALCDRTIVMRQGKIVETGLSSDLFSKPAHDYTRSLIDSGRKTSRRAVTARNAI